MLRVSVIIPTYRRHKEVIRAVTSALEQSVSPIEVLVVNDGPDVNKGGLLEGLDDKRVRYIEAARRTNASATRNAGITQAVGDWVALLDDDDVWLPGKLERQFRTLQASGQSEAILAGQERVHSADGNKHLRPSSADGKPMSAARVLFGAGGVNTSTLLAPKSVFLRHPFNEAAERHEDWEWLLQAGQQLPVIIAPEVICERWITLGEGLSRPGDFDYTWAWYMRNRVLIDSPSRVRLICGPLTRKAAFDRNPRALFRLLPELGRNGGLRPANMARFSIPWFIPCGLRRVVRNRLSRNTDA